MPRNTLRTALFAGLAATAMLAGSAEAFVDNSFPNETFTYRGRTWVVPIQNRTAGYFDWDTVAGCVDYTGTYKYNCPGDKKITLSLDDGPSPYTAKALDLLNAAGAKATFCQMGIKMTPATEAIIRRIADEGHELCIHTENHLHLTELSTRSIIDEIMAVMDKYKAILGVTPRWFRPPFGESDMRVRAIVQQLGLEMFLWNLDSWDWKENNTESMERLRGAMATPNTWEWANPAGGSYEILAHDIHQVTVDEFVPGVISEAKKQGWTMTVPSDGTCYGGNRWIEGGEDVYKRERANAKGLIAAGITSNVPVPADYEQLGAAPPPEASNFGKPTQTSAGLAPTAAPTTANAKPTGAATDDNVKPTDAGTKPHTVEPIHSGAGMVAAGASLIAAAVFNALLLVA